MNVVPAVFVYNDRQWAFLDRGYDHYEAYCKMTQIFENKWNFNFFYSGNLRNDLLKYIDCSKENLALLETGCAMGANFTYIKALNPKAELCGIELCDGTAYFAKKSYIENNEDIIQKFTDAIYKGEQWVQEHSSQEIAEVVQSFFPDTDINLLTTAIQSYKDIDAWNETPVLKKEAFDRLQEVMQEAGELTTKAPYETIVNNEFAKKAIK